MTGGIANVSLDECSDVRVFSCGCLGTKKVCVRKRLAELEGRANLQAESALGANAAQNRDQFAPRIESHFEGALRTDPRTDAAPTAERFRDDFTNHVRFCHA